MSARLLTSFLLVASLAAAQEPGVRKARDVMADPAALPRLTASIGQFKASLWALSKKTGVPVPIQYIWGADDPLTPRERGYRLFAELGKRQAHGQFIGDQRAQPAQDHLSADGLEEVVDVGVDQPGVAVLVQGVDALDGHAD